MEQSTNGAYVPDLTPEQILKRFEPLINNLWEDQNLRIGGGTALRLHGLVFRKSNDVDIIVHRPTQRQRDIVKALEVFDEVVNYNTNKEDRHAWKFTKDGATLDIIFEEKTKDINADEFNQKPELHINILGRWFPVQPVKRIIDAKASYIIHDNNTRDERARKKDMVDFLNLKNDNFNF